ncbi:sialate O-acetylesterase [Massilia sp. NP310]|uniref:sialate O-acetylesterase n=1 Tax=Massilia sp. NP310 TaxID=2861282 RepID=UPI001C6274A9|nr:sialate O-acetylesterase [Massilia sp. NP310]QYG01871.1 hypothetical protein KY496_26885 [Massilia sp. NP310]
MTVKFNRTQQLRLVRPVDSFGSITEWTLAFYIEISSGNTLTEPQMILSTGELVSGSLNLAYYGPGSPYPESIGFSLNAGTTPYKTPHNAFPLGWKGVVLMQRIGASISLHWCPVLATAPIDASSVKSANDLISHSGTVSGLTKRTFVVGQRADGLRGLEQTIARLGLVHGTLSMMELARLAYGETLQDLGRTPVIYRRLDNATDTEDLGTEANVTTVTGTLVDGAAPGWGYVPAAPAAPAFTAPPVLVGEPAVGVPVSYTPGTVTGSPTPAVTRNWLLDGVAISDATAATYTPVAGDVGKVLAIRETATSSSGSASSTSAGVVVVAGEESQQGVDSLSAMKARRIFQRIGNSADVKLSGTYSALPATIEAQLIASADGATVLQPWTQLTATTIAADAWEGTLKAIQGGGYRAQVRFKDANGAVIYTSSIDSNSWGVGEIIVGAGSSTIHGWWTSGTYTANTYISTYRTTDGWTWKAFPSVSNGIARKIANDLATRLGVPVGMLGTGESGTLLKSWTDANSTYFGKLRSAIIEQGGKIGALMISMGSNDAANNIVVSRAAHAAMLRKFIADVRALTGQPDLKVLISGFNRRLDTNDTQANYVRQAELDVGDDPNVYHFPTVDMALSGDGIHLASYTESGDRVVGIFNPVLAGDAAYRRGPAIMSITASGDKFRVALQHRNGTDFAPTSGNSGFVAADDAGALTILSVARLNATAIEVAVDRIIGSNPRLSYMSGANPDVSAFTFDNGAVALPMDVDIGRAVAVGAPAEDTTAPVMTGSVAVAAITTAGATLSWPAASDDVGVVGYEYSINGGTSYTNVGASRTVVLTGLAAGTAYAARVRAYDAAGNRSSPLMRSFTTEAETPPDQDGFDATKVAPARKVVFPGGTRVVVFGGPVVVYPGGPYQQDGRWTIDKHPLDEFYCVADISFDLAESGTTAASVVAVPGGVQVLQQPVVQGALIPVKIGGLDELSDAANFCTLRITLANGEQIDRTIWFSKLQGVWTVSKDPDDKRYFVADVGNILADSGTQIASALPAVPVGVTVLEQPVAQGALILVKLGGLDVSADPLNHCTLPFLCANGEKFFRTIHFNRVDN